MIVNEESLCFGLLVEQKMQFEDVTLNSRKLQWTENNKQNHQ